MRLSLLVHELAAKLDPSAAGGEALEAQSAKTALVAKITALDAARAGAVGRGLQLAAEEMHELTLLTGSQDHNIRQLGEGTRATVAEIGQIFEGLGTDRWCSVSALQQDLKPAKDRLTLLISQLAKNISGMPQSLSSGEAPQSADRVQIETLLRQVMINGRDRLSALEIVVEALLLAAESATDLEQLIALDSDSLEYSTRQRLAALTRDKVLDETILANQVAH